MPSVDIQPSQSLFRPAPMTITTTFGHRIAMLRNQRRISSWQFADFMCISRQQLDRIERGDEEVDLDFVDAIATEFGLSMSDLLFGL